MTKLARGASWAALSMVLATTPVLAQSQADLEARCDYFLKPDVAIAACTTLIDASSPTSVAIAETYKKRGAAYRQRRELANALKDYDQAIRLKPNYVEALSDRGYLLGEMKEFDRAVQDYDQVIRLDPQNAGAFDGRAKALGRLGQHERAIKDLDQVVKLLLPGTKDATVLYLRCWNRAALGQLDAALRDCNAALRENPDEVGALDSRGLVRLKAGRHDAAITDYTAAIALDARRASALYGRGLAHQRKGDAARAAADIAAAKAIQADIAEEFVRLGVR